MTEYSNCSIDGIVDAVAGLKNNNGRIGGGGGETLQKQQVGPGGTRGDVRTNQYNASEHDGCVTASTPTARMIASHDSATTSASAENITNYKEKAAKYKEENKKLRKEVLTLKVELEAGLQYLKKDGGSSAEENHYIATSIHTTNPNGDSSSCSRDEERQQQQEEQLFTSRLGQRIWQQYQQQQQQQLQQTHSQQYQKSQLPNNFLQLPQYSLLLHESSREVAKVVNNSSKQVSICSSSSNSPINTSNTTITRPPRNSRSTVPIIHPFAKALSKRNIITKHDEITVTKQLYVFTERTRQWESKLSFRLRGTTESHYTLCPILDIRDVEYSYYASFLTDDDDCMPPYFDYKLSKPIRNYAPSTPLICDWRSKLSSSPSSSSSYNPKNTNGGYHSNGGHRSNELPMTIKSRIIHDIYNNGGVTYFNEYNALQDMSYDTQQHHQQHQDIIYVPLMNVRKALSVRLVNSFIDNRNRTAFTIWCYDVESGKEWYAPVRYYNDFKDLRYALINIDKMISDIPFPSSSSFGGGIGSWSRKTTKEVEKGKDAHRNHLEIFLRRVFAGVYRGSLHPYLAEIAVHLQTFVGCDAVSLDDNEQLGGGDKVCLSKQVAMSESMYGKRMPDPKMEPNTTARMNLKRSIMRYVYRLFLIPVVEELVTQFVDTARGKVTSSSEAGVVQGNNRSRRQGNNMTNKVESSKIVDRIRDFIDQVQELILEGCRDDFISILERRDFLALVDDTDNSIRDDLFQEAVREQIELEIYVPLRSTISKYLVYAWFNEDMEMKHKMRALMDKPQSYFRIPKEQRSRSDWKSVSQILEEGVGRSTLPCVKLLAVVNAAKEISQLEGEERVVFPESTFFDGTVITKVKALGADDFLPIFIFAFVRSKIERPYALCELLSLMCDPSKTNGETGYYLATFHAALMHIHELDLTCGE